MWLYHTRKFYEWHIVTPDDALNISTLHATILDTANRFFASQFIWDQHYSLIKCYGCFSDPIFWTIELMDINLLKVRVFVRGNGCEVCTFWYYHNPTVDQLTLDQIKF